MSQCNLNLIRAVKQENIPSHNGQTYLKVTTLPNLNPTLANRPTAKIFHMTAMLGLELLYLGLLICQSVFLTSNNNKKRIITLQNLMITKL